METVGSLLFEAPETITETGRQIDRLTVVSSSASQGS